MAHQSGQAVFLQLQPNAAITGGQGILSTNTTLTGGLLLRTMTTSDIIFATDTSGSGANRWTINGTTGHLLGAADNTYDIGASGATRPRTAYLGTALNVGTEEAGTAAGDLSAGLTGNNNKLNWTQSNAQLIVNSWDLLAAHPQLQLRNNDDTNALSRPRINMSANGASSIWEVTNLAASPARTAYLSNDVNLSGGWVMRTQGAHPIAFETDTGGSGGTRWSITGAGHLLGGTDNTYDIGASGATRPRTAYLGTSVISPLVENTGASADLTLGARSATYNLNDAANTTLVTTNQTIIGAINEVSAAGEQLLATVTSIDAKTVAATNLYTATATTIITKVILLCTAATAITVEATAGVGIAAGEDDVYASELLTGLDAADKAFTYIAAGTRVAVLNTQILKLGIDTGSTGTSQTFTAYVFGYEA